MKTGKNIHTKPGYDSLPWAIWIWNLKISETELEKQINLLISQGFGGIAIQPGREMSPAYMSEEFLDLFDSALKIAKEKNIKIKLADDFSLPWNDFFNYQINQNKPLRAQRLILDQIITQSDQIDTTITLRNPANSIVLATKITDRQIADVKNVPVSAGKSTISWKNQPSEWKIFIFVKEYITSFDNQYIPNLLNNETSQLYIKSVLDPLLTHFKTYSSDVFTGFVNEFSFNSFGNNGLPWDDNLITIYKSKFKKDLIKLLPALYSDQYPQAQKIRVQFYSFLFDLVHELYSQPLENWSKKNHLSQWFIIGEKNFYKSSNELSGGFLLSKNELQSVGFQNTDGLPGSKLLYHLFSNNYNDINGREVLTILGRNKQSFSGSIQSLKKEFDQSILLGKSKIIIDGFFFNIDQRNGIKSAFNPGWYSTEKDHLSKICAYITQVNDLIKDIHFNHDIAIFSPFTDILSDYLPNNNELSRKKLLLLQNISSSLDRLNISYDFIRNESLSTLKIKDNGRFGSSQSPSEGYQALIIPCISFISKELLSFIESLVQKGIFVLFIDELPKGTVEDDNSTQISGKINKLISSKTNKASLCKVADLEARLQTLTTSFNIQAGISKESDLLTASGSNESCSLYIFHNSSDNKDIQIQTSIPEHKCLCFMNCEKSETYEIDTAEKKSGKLHFPVDMAPSSTYFIIGSSSKAGYKFSQLSKYAVDPFLEPNRNYRVVLKDQWNFETSSVNALPLSNWSIRIGLSRESGFISHFYETNFSVRSIPSNCYLVINDNRLILNKIHTNIDNGIELSINGTKLDSLPAAIVNNLLSNNNLPESSLSLFLNSGSCIFDIKNHLVNDNNRISIRTTGNAIVQQAMHFPPLLIGNFPISKGQNGLTIDSVGSPVGYSSWTKYGYPYLSGKGIYRQQFEIPHDYNKIILRLSQVSGTVDIKLNGNDVGTYSWHPIEIDITSICDSKKNEIEIGVLNTIDNIVRMNGRASGLIGEVYLDIY